MSAHHHSRDTRAPAGARLRRWRQCGWARRAGRAAVRAVGWCVILGALARLGAAELTLAIELRWQGAPLAVPAAAVTTPAGQRVTVTRLSALLSEVTLWRADGGAVRLPGQFGFIDAEQGRMAVTFSGVPEGEYAGLDFSLGLPPEINHADPGQWPAGHPLNPLVNALHWGWQGGFVFLALEGKWREGDTAEETARGFSYHLATDAGRMPVRFRAQWPVAGPTTARLALDLGRVWRDLTIRREDGSESTHSAKTDPLAPRLAQAVERAWFWLEAVSDPVRPPAEAADTPAPGRGAPGRSGGGATPRAFAVPAGFPQPALPVDNPLTVEGVALGERLFGDRRLSGNGTQSCASCHQAERAFSDRVAFSRGADGRPGARNAMPLFNLPWSPAFAWDGTQPRIRDQALAAMTNPVEMHAEPARVTAELSTDAATVAAFAAAFGSPEVTAERIGRALEQYLLTLVSADSRFDRSLRGEVELTPQEQAGFALFVTEFDPARGQRGADCFHCHGGALFTDHGFKHNGLHRTSADAGRARATGRTSDAGKFKTPALRNVALTAPYMHDGRFATLAEVVAHYDHGVQRAAALDPNLAKHPEAGLGLTSAEQAALVAFLETLTDPGWTR